MGMKKGHKYGVSVKPERDLTSQETAYVVKTLNTAATALRLRLKGNIIATGPNKPKPYPKKRM